MEIQREFEVFEIKATSFANEPFQMVIGSHSPRRRDRESTLIMDDETLAQFIIPKSIDLIGRTLVCTFQSKELAIHQDGHWAGYVDNKSIEKDDLRIDALRKEEVTSPQCVDISRPLKHSKTSRKLELSSFGWGGQVHSCPCYKIVLELTEEEYEACQALSAVSVFKVSFQLKPEEV